MQLPGTKPQLPFFPQLLDRAFLEEPLLRSLICQAVLITRWEQNK